MWGEFGVMGSLRAPCFFCAPVALFSISSPLSLFCFQCTEKDGKAGQEGLEMLYSLTLRGSGLKMVSKMGEVCKTITEPAKGGDRGWLKNTRQIIMRVLLRH